MLEKNEKICFFDAHFHLSALKNPDFQLKEVIKKGWKGCSCILSKEDLKIQNNFLDFAPKSLFFCAGLHPDTAVEMYGKMHSAYQGDCPLPQIKSIIEEKSLFVEKLAEEKKIWAVGEAGFDFFTKGSRKTELYQKLIFERQLEIAQKFQLPLVIHCRKGIDDIFKYSQNLKNLPAVLFHSFMGSPIQAQSLQKKGINTFFSFGKQTLNNNKNVIQCVKTLSSDCLLCETDAPFQFLHGESGTELKDIEIIFRQFIEIRKEEPEKLSLQMEKNFLQLFNSKQN